MNKNIFPHIKKFTCVALASVMMFNLTTTSLAQAVDLKKLQELHGDRIQGRLEREYQVHTAVSESTRLPGVEAQQRYFEMQLEAEKEFLRRNPEVLLARGIKGKIMGGPLDVLQNEGNKEEYAGPIKKDEFKKEYSAALEAEKTRALKSVKTYRDNALKDINAQAQEYMESLGSEAVTQWQSEAVAELDAWYAEAQAQVQAAIKKEAGLADRKYDEYVKEVKKIEDEHMQKVIAELKEDAKELMRLFHKNEHVKVELIQVAPTLLMVSKDTFSDPQKILLRSLAKETLQADEKCLDTKKANCDLQLNAVAILGIIGDPSYDSSVNDAKAVYDFVVKYFEHPLVVPVLLTSMGALLNMKAYGYVSNVLDTAVKKDGDMGSIDMLSLATWAEGFSTIRGQYFGNITKFAEFKTGDGKVSNGWTEVAIMIAKEGSKEAASILSRYGINNCKVMYEMQLNTKYEPKLFCGGMKPFIAGALVSGEKINFDGIKEEPSGPGNGLFSRPSNAGQYTPVEVKYGQHYDSRGNINTYSIADSQDMQKQLDIARNNLEDFAKRLGISKQGIFALYMINAGMGDMTAESERDLDKALLEANPEIKKYIGDYAVVDDAKFRAKQSRQTRKDTWIKILTVADIAILVWCFWDISRLAYKGIRGFGRIGMRISHSYKLASTGSATARLAYLRENIAFFQQVRSRSNARAASLLKVKTRIHNATEPLVLAQRSLYTSAPLPMTGMPKAGSTVGNALANTRFVAETASFSMDTKAAYNASAGIPNRVLDLQKTKQALTLANNAADNAYITKGMFNKFRSYNSHLAKNTRTAFRNPEFAQFEYLEGLKFSETLKNADKFNVTREYIRGKNSIKLVSTHAMPKVVQGTKTLELFLDVGEKQAIGMPVQVGLGERYPWYKAAAGKAAEFLNISWRPKASYNKIPGVKGDKLESVLFTKNAAKEDWLTFIANDKNLIDPDFFKMGLSDGSIPSLIRTATRTGTPLELKFAGELQGASKYWIKTKDFFKGKKSLFSGEGEVFIRNGAALQKTNVTLNTTYHFNGMKVILEENNTLSILGKSNKMLTNAHSFALPKHQIGNFSKIAMAYGDYSNPIALTLSGAKNKMSPLFFVTALSLSAASSGLIGPIEKNYGERTFMEKFAITVALPYAGSILSPVVAPFVKRFGAINVLKTSSAIAVGSLAVPAVFGGYHGFGDIHAGNPNNPGLGLLFVSAGFIGISAALTRSAFNPLMQSIGGSSNLLKSMAFKNVSSFLMVLPPLAFSTLDLWKPKYRTGADGSPLIGADGNKVLKPTTDFSFSYPFLATVVASSLFFLQKARISSNIGRVGNYSMKAQAGREMWEATKLVGKKDTWPIMLGATAVLGAEASLFNSYSMKEANRYAGEYINPNGKWAPTIPVVAVAATAFAPFWVRYGSKPLLKTLGGQEKVATYKKLLTMSMLTAGTGGLILTQQDNTAAFTTGMVLVGVGFANTTNSFLKLGTFNIRAAETAKLMPMLREAGVSTQSIKNFATLGSTKTINLMREAGSSERSISAILQAEKLIKPVITNFEVVYPGVHIGMALVPMAFSNAAEKRETNLGETKLESLQNSLYIPMGVLGVSGAVGAYGMGVRGPQVGKGLRAFNAKLPVGLLGPARFIFGKPSVENMMNNFKNHEIPQLENRQGFEYNVFKNFTPGELDFNDLKLDIKPVELKSIDAQSEEEVLESEEDVTESSEQEASSEAEEVTETQE